MLIKLAFKNASKSIRDYLIYFFTLTFGVCIFYMFNSINAQQAMMNLTREQERSARMLSVFLNCLEVRDTEISNTIEKLIELTKEV